MSLEKSSYLLLGCLAVGSILQNNLNLHWGYFIGISLFLFGLCFFIQIVVFKKKDSKSVLMEVKQQERQQQQIEKLISLISNVQVEQTEKLYSVIQESIQLLDNSNKNEMKESMEQYNIIVEEVNHLSEGVTQNTVVLEKVLKAYSLDVEKAQSQNENIIQKMTEQCSSFMKTNEWLEKINKAEEGRKSLQKTISNIQNSIQTIQHTDDAKLKKLDLVIDTIENCKEEHEMVLNKVEELQIETNKLADDRVGKISTCLENITNLGKESRDDLLGCISNIQTMLETMDSNVSNIRRTNDDVSEKLDDVVRKIEDSKAECIDKLNEINGVVEKSVNEQMDIITDESQILEQYDKLLGYINDEVVVKLIADSDNLLKCMKDCYCTLESMRQVRK